MKAILEFELPEDKENFNTASRGMDWALVVWDMDQMMHKKIKYSELTDDTRKEIENLRLTMSDMLINRGLLYPE
jgi:hypothetical protein|tara:strand:+ start:592 stop:813 length:222 start_codon:yes stop_codon:yes gene_type:complete